VAVAAAPSQSVAEIEAGPDGRGPPSHRPLPLARRLEAVTPWKSLVQPPGRVRPPVSEDLRPRVANHRRQAALVFRLHVRSAAMSVLQRALQATANLLEQR